MSRIVLGGHWRELHRGNKMTCTRLVGMSKHKCVAYIIGMSIVVSININRPSHSMQSTSKVLVLSLCHCVPHLPVCTNYDNASLQGWEESEEMSTIDTMTCNEVIRDERADGRGRRGGGHGGREVGEVNKEGGRGR